jgi:hypothetical protein
VVERRACPSHTETRLVEIAPLGERLSALRLCEATALATVRRSLAQHGQLSALTLERITSLISIVARGSAENDAVPIGRGLDLGRGGSISRCRQALPMPSSGSPITP